MKRKNERKSMINNITIEGNITKALEIKQIKNGEDSVINFSVANHLYKKEKPEFINCTVFGKRAESMFNYCEKGSRVLVEGKLKTKSYAKEVKGEIVNFTSTYVQVEQYRKIDIPMSKNSNEDFTQNDQSSIEEEVTSTNKIDEDLPF